MKRLIEDEPEFKSSLEYVFREPLLFGDYRNALELGEPRIYEDLQDHEASKALFEQVNLKYLIFGLIKRLSINKKTTLLVRKAPLGATWSNVTPHT